MRKRPGRLSPKWRVLPFALAPSPAELRGLLADLVSAYGLDGACAVLGVSTLTVRSWVAGARLKGSSARLVWLTYMICLRPGRLESAFDLVTWGRFTIERSEVKLPGSSWSGWSI